MSTDESTISFPVNKLKAETLRSMAKDLGVMPGGKKDELLERLREISVTGWVTPIKRKPDPETSESTPTTKKRSRVPRTPNNSSATVIELNSPPRRASQRSRRTAVVEVSPRKQQHGHPSNKVDVPNGGNLQDSDHTKGVFDDYLTSGPTSVFIAGDDLLTMVDELSAPAALTLWKFSSCHAKRHTSSLARADQWLIPANEGDKVQNLTAFKETYKDVLDKLRSLKTAAPESKETRNDVGKKDDSPALKEPLSGLWHQISVSRNLGTGALAVKLIKGTIEGKEIVPIKDAKEEEGTFWLSSPTAAKEDDVKLLDESVKLLS